MQSDLKTTTAKTPAIRVKRATVASVANQPKASTEQAIKGYNYLKSHSSLKAAPR